MEDALPKDSELVSPNVPGGRKAAKVLEAAGQVFLQQGYEGTTVDEVARCAGVSKPTVYRYFADKQALYDAFIRNQCASYVTRLFTVDLAATNVRSTLLRIARDYIELIFSPGAMGIFRISLAESKRFPELGRLFYEAGPAAGTQRLSLYLAGATARQLLDIEDVDRAAHQFIALCKEGLFYKVQFNVISNVSEDEKQALAESVVDMFLKAYMKR